MKVNRVFVENFNFVTNLKTRCYKIFMWDLMETEVTSRICTLKLMVTKKRGNTAEVRTILNHNCFKKK